ncbi:MAG: nucleotide exchange factor GrpE, partial [Candidatus Staskawiczbacteria bacterium RIFCSPLOWO2_01_FULL_37_25b]
MEEEKNTKKNDAKEEPNEFKKITEELEECKTKREEYLNGWKRERSDFLNHKKEEMERIGIIIKYANEELILKILPILDNIFLAESQVPEEYKEEDTPSS